MSSLRLRVSAVKKDLVHHRRRLEAFAAADWGDFQVECGMLGMRAFFDNLFVGFMLCPDLNEFRGVHVMLAEVHTEPTLTIMYLHHKILLIKDGEYVANGRPASVESPALEKNCFLLRRDNAHQVFAGISQRCEGVVAGFTIAGHELLQLRGADVVG